MTWEGLQPCSGVCVCIFFFYIADRVVLTSTVNLLGPQFDAYTGSGVCVCVCKLVSRLRLFGGLSITFQLVLPQLYVVVPSVLIF